MSETLNLIYGLRDPRTQEIRYVGQSSVGVKRINKHRYKCYLKDDYRSRWLKSLKKSGLDFEHVILEEVADRSLLDAAEIKWISIGRAALGSRLTNYTDGGCGTLGVKLSAEKRAALSANWKPRPFTEKRRAALLAISAANRGRPRSEENKRKLSVALKGRRFTPEQIQHMREGQQRRHAKAIRVI